MRPKILFSILLPGALFPPAAVSIRTADSAMVTNTPFAILLSGWNALLGFADKYLQPGKSHQVP
jgi:hypothetical protein